MGQCSSIKFTSISSEMESSPPQWAFQLNGAPAAAIYWHFKGHMLKVIIES